MEKQFGTKGAIFSLDAISAAEYVKDTKIKVGFVSTNSITLHSPFTIVTAKRI